MTEQEPWALAIDQGTSGTTVAAVAPDGTLRATRYREVGIQYPRTGWVEQYPGELVDVSRSLMLEVLADMDSVPSCIGITNQRETVIPFYRKDGSPAGPAIVWQCKRSAEICEEHRARGEEDILRERTGLLIDPYFSGTKIEWMLQNDTHLRAKASAGDIVFGTVDTFLIAALTGGRTVITDASNASRTLLYDITKGSFSPELASLFGVPMAALPEVVDSAGRRAITDPDQFGGLAIPISGIAGDQQAALFGQGCVRSGMAKNTYGTGSFVLANIGHTCAPPGEGLLTTVAWQIDGVRTYAREGSIFTTGAVLKWLRDGLGLIHAYDEVGPAIASVEDTHGCHFIPALSGMGSPFWRDDVRGAFMGLEQGTRREHCIRAVVDAAAYRTQDVLESMELQGNEQLDELRVDGGMTTIDYLCATQATLSRVVVRRSRTRETTVRGAGLLALVGEGFIPELDAVAENIGTQADAFKPDSAQSVRIQRDYESWKEDRDLLLLRQRQMHEG